MRPPRAWSVAVVALLAALVLALPAAVADHAYSHRYLIYGRVVDSNGDAVQNLTVQVATRLFHPNEGGCGSREGSRTDAFGLTGTRVVTNEYGEFVYCYHEHSMSRGTPGEATISIPTEGYYTNVTLDPYFRETIAPIVLKAPHPNATHALDSSYTVLGRVWEPHPDGVILEENTVYGLTLVDSRVNLTLTLPDGTALHNSTVTNNYGDFAVRFPTERRVTSGIVTMQTFGNYTVFDNATVDPKLGMTVFQTQLPEGAVAPAKSVGRVVAVVLGSILVLIAIAIAIRMLVVRSQRSQRSVTSRASRRRNQR